MADVWTTPATWTTGEAVTASKMNTNVRDNLDALLAGLKDASADADVVQTTKSGTLAARSGVTHLVGRQYKTTDTGQTFISNGTSWEHVSGSAYDDFFRGNSTTITPSRSGHAWTETSGDWAIDTNALDLASGAPGVALLNTGGILNRSYEVYMLFLTHSSAASIDVACICKAASDANKIYVRLTTSALDFRKTIASVDSSIGSVVTSATASAVYAMRIKVVGNAVDVHLETTTGGVSSFLRAGVRDNDVLHANLATADNIGVRLGNTTENISLLEFRP